MSISMFGAMIHSHPEEARAKILAAIKDAGGNRKQAAEALGTTHRSLYRFIERLRLWSEIDRMVADNGFPEREGPPRSSDRIRDAVLAAGGELKRAARSLDMRQEALYGRIQELGLWNDLNRRLKALGRKPMRAPREAA